MTLREAINRECAKCLGVSARGGHDCLNADCPLYPAHPFRGRPLPTTHQPENYVYPADLAGKLHKKVPKRRASKGLVRKMCRACLPGRGKCTATDCSLYKWSPKK